jgi:cytochrome c oxidase subunit 2
MSDVKEGHASPLGYFLHSAGPASIPSMHLGWVFTAIVTGVCIIVGILLLYALFRRRLPADKQHVGREGGGMAWIYIGTGLSTVVLLGMGIYMLVVLNHISTPPSSPALAVTVTGHQWWWKVEYDNFTTANEIHIPSGVPVLIKLKSADVIHAFWVPTLAGKTQAIPGLINRQWIQADKPGLYRGDCAEFCGVQHAHMGFDVIAQDMSNFTAWANHQREAAQSPASVGQKIFMTKCAACHSVRGTQAAGAYAPDLTHLQSRRMIAAGLMTNTPEHLADWIVHAQELKPDSLMPDIALSADEQAALTAYLETLK